VWWVGSGLLNMLPIHASGYHDSSPPETALDRVISSYAPSVKSLAYARTRPTGPERFIAKEKVVLISMPTTSERKDLRICGNGDQILGGPLLRYIERCNNDA